MSTIEAEFFVISEACKELLCMKKLLQEFGFVQDKYILFVDSQNAIHLGKNPTFYSRSRHIDVGYHWIHDDVDDKLLELDKVHSDDNYFDLITKALPRGKFETFDIAGLAIISNNCEGKIY